MPGDSSPVKCSKGAQVRFAQVKHEKRFNAPEVYPPLEGAQAGQAPILRII